MGQFRLSQGHYTDSCYLISLGSTLGQVTSSIDSSLNAIAKERQFQIKELLSF